MKNRADTFTTTRNRKLFAPNGAIISDITEPQIRGYDIVSGYSLVQGDKKMPNSFSYEATRTMNYTGTRTTYSPNGAGHYISGIQVGPDQGVSALGRLTIPDRKNFHYNRALDNLNEKVRGQLDLGVSLAEAGQIKSLFASAARLEEYIGKNPPPGGSLGERVVKRGAKALGRQWLKWQYGIRPLIQDIYGVTDELFRHQLPQILRVKAKSSQPLDGQYRLATVENPSKQSSVYVSGVQGCEFHLAFKDNGGVNLARWSSLNPASFAWELLTLSFVIDWVYDVGGYIRNLETSLLYDSVFVSGYVTELFTHTGSHDASVDLRAVPNGTYNWWQMKSDWKYTRFSRTVLGSYPLPRKPTFQVQLGSERLLSAASLLSQHLR